MSDASRFDGAAATAPAVAPAAGTDHGDGAERAHDGSRAREAAKRAIDLVVATVGLVIALPILAILSLAVRIESPGPAIFRQTRVGRRGRPFTVLKLRTMVPGAERLGAGLYYERDDPRFTRIGLFARRFSLDELPQLVNVLRGDMSIVGPRPMLPVTVAEYPDDYAVILRVRPGITGLAQVSGRNALPRRRRLPLDRTYAETWSIGLDLRIMLRTVTVALTGEGQRIDQGRSEVER